MSSHNTTIDRRAAGIAAPPPPSRQLQEHDQGSYYFRHADKIAAGGEGDAFLDNEPELEVQEEEAPVSKKKSSCSMNKPLVITLIVLAAVVIIGVVIAVVVVMVNNSNDEVQPENDPPAMQNREDLGSLNAFLQDESNRFHEPVVLSDGQTYENKKAEKLCDVELQSLRDESGELNLEKLNRCTIGGDDHDGGQPDGPERRIALWPVDMDQIPHRSAAAAVVQHQETKVEGATASFLPRVRQHKEDHEPTAARDQHQDEDASTEKTVVKRVPKMFPNHNLQAFYTAWNDAEGHPSTHFQDSNNIPEVLLCETKHLETGFVVANSKALCRYPAIDTEGRTWNMPEVWLLTEEEQELLAKNTSPVYFMNETLQQLANAYRTFHNMAVPPTQPVPREDIPVLPLVPSPFPRPGGDGNNGGTNGAAGGVANITPSGGVHAAAPGGANGGTGGVANITPSGGVHVAAPGGATGGAGVVNINPSGGVHVAAPGGATGGAGVVNITPSGGVHVAPPPGGANGGAGAVHVNPGNIHFGNGGHMPSPVHGGTIGGAFGGAFR